jgi:hypothetical protein
MDRKLTTWFLRLMGLVVVKGGFGFFMLDKKCTEKQGDSTSTIHLLVSCGIYC